MSSKKNFVPQNPGDYDNFFKNLAQYVSAKCSGSTPERDHISQKDLNSLNEAYETWYTAFVPTLKPHDHPVTAERNRVKKETEHILRVFINRFLRHPPVTDHDRDEMGIRNRKNTRSVHIEVTETVSFVFRIREIRKIWIDFRVEGAAGRGKPEGYDGAIIIYAVLDKPPASFEELTGHVKANRSPYPLTFAETQRGKTVYVAIAWQNGRGNMGQWSAIQSTVIP